MYPPDQVDDTREEFLYEYGNEESKDWVRRVGRNNAYHRNHFLDRGKKHLYTNWVEAIAHTAYGRHGKFQLLPGEKAVFMNPATTRTEIDAFIDQLEN